MTQGLDIIYNIFIWVNPIYLPLIIFFLGFTSRECLFLNTVFLLIVSLYRFKVPTIFLHCDEKFFFLYWPDELSLRNFNKGFQPLCCLQVFFRFWGNVDILYHHNILIFWINPGQSKQILVHLHNIAASCSIKVLMATSSFEKSYNWRCFWMILSTPS